MADRLDFIVEVDSVGLYTAKKMDIANKVYVIPGAEFCKGGNYLAFSKKTDYENLSVRFNTELELFKTSAEYEAILQKYGLSL